MEEEIERIKSINEEVNPYYFFHIWFTSVKQARKFAVEDEAASCDAKLGERNQTLTTETASMGDIHSKELEALLEEGNVIEAYRIMESGPSIFSSLCLFTVVLFFFFYGGVSLSV